MSGWKAEPVGLGGLPAADDGIQEWGAQRVCLGLHDLGQLGQQSQRLAVDGSAPRRPGLARLLGSVAALTSQLRRSSSWVYRWAAGSGQPSLFFS